MEIKIVIALMSVVLTLIGYFYYFRDIFAHKTKPHAFSWLVWGALTALAFAGQLSDNAGPGAWITGVTALVSFVIFGLALKRGEKDITTSDKWNLGAAAFALLLWCFTSDPLLSVIIITIVDFLGFLPTIRKSYKKPYEETLIHYILAGLKFALAIVALDNYTLVTWLYPASLVAANLFFVVMSVVQRKRLPIVETF
ncbi:MAG TPA: hypothetical protein VFZ48_03405 [Candidatus Saccharimonadales bacterium]